MMIGIQSVKWAQGWESEGDDVRSNSAPIIKQLKLGGEDSPAAATPEIEALRSLTEV